MGRCRAPARAASTSSRLTTSSLPVRVNCISGAHLILCPCLLCPVTLRHLIIAITIAVSPALSRGCSPQGRGRWASTGHLSSEASCYNRTGSVEVDEMVTGLTSLSLMERLAAMEKRYQELGELLAQPEVASDYQRLQALARERASLEGVVAKYRGYQAATRSLEETQAMLEGGLGLLQA